MIKGHGDDIHDINREIVANFSTNVWYGADREIIREIIEKNIDAVYSYPEPLAESFCKEVAKYHNLKFENILAGNGATELLYLIAQATKKSKTIIPVPSFAEYEDACNLYEHDINFVPLDEYNTHEGDVLFLCNPNNPDGRLYDSYELEKFINTRNSTLVVIDESFIDFVPGAYSFIQTAKERANLLVVRSMTKNYSIPGLRLGYVVGNPFTIDLLKKYKQPWSVNGLAIEIGKELLKRGGKILPDINPILERKKKLIAEINKIEGFEALDSSTTFFLVKTKFDSIYLKIILLENFSILIRDASNFRNLDNHYFRINTLSEDKNKLLLNALKSISDTLCGS